MTLLAGFIGLPLLTPPLLYITTHRPNTTTWRYGRMACGLMLALLWAALLLVILNSNSTEAMTYQLGMVRLRMDGVSLLISTLAVLLVTIVVIFSLQDIASESGSEKYYVLLFILSGLLIGLVCAADLFNLWVWFEGTAIVSYLLVAYYNHQKNALAASVKYFIQTAVGSVLVLFGIALVLMETGTLDFTTMQTCPSPLLVVAGTLFLMGFGVKAALFPNHTWLPDAYAESPAGISAFLSGVVTVTGIIALLKALPVCAWSAESWGTLLLIIASLNIVIGNILAVTQTQVKRILAYSSISHIGFILLAAGIGLTASSSLGMRAAMLHLFFHGLMKSLAFLALGTFAFAYGDDYARRLTIDDLRGAGTQYPAMAFALVVSMLSLTGIPLLVGFVSKWQIFIAGIQSGSIFLIVVVVFAALNSVFSLAYYLPIINALTSSEKNDRWQPARALPLAMRVPVIILAVSLIALGIFPGVINWLIDPATAALFAQFTVLGG